jgi:hypothetical protein
MGSSDPYGGQISDNTPLHKLDVASATVSYEGWAQSGTATSAAKWLIMKTEKVGNVTTQTSAGGGTSHNQIWDNRASLSYS